MTETSAQPITETSVRSPLELSGSELRELVELALERIVEHVDSLPEQPTDGSAGSRDLVRSLREPWPAEGEAPAALFDRLFREVVPKSLNTASPGFLAYIPGGGLLHAAVADLIADAVNRYVTVHEAAPGLAQIEATVIRWFCDMVGYPRGAGGFLASGGSIANLSGVIAARCDRLPEDFLRGTIYVPDQAHHSTVKAARLAGFPSRNVRSVPVDDQFRVRLDEAQRQISDDRAEGFEPFLLVGSAGTTNTGAVDDLDGLADLAADEGLWLHVDAAYGGFFLLTERGRQRIRGIDRADSITLDPHKGLFLPYGTGCLLARDRAALERAHRADAHYMPVRDTVEAVSFCDVSPELSRSFRGLRVWLPMKMHGVGVFREALDEKLDLALWAAEQLAAVPGIDVVAPPQLSTLAFRLAPEGVEEDDLDGLNRELLVRINRRQRINLTGTTVGCGFVLRLSILSHRTHLERLRLGIEDIRRSVGELVGRDEGGGDVG